MLSSTTTAMKPTFSDLPEEILHLILLCLPPPDIAICRSVCKKVFATITNSTEIQLHMELYIEGRILAWEGSRSAKDMLDELVDLRGQINQYSPEASWSFSIYTRQYIYDIWEGVIAFTPEIEGKCIKFSEILQSPDSDSNWQHEMNDLAFRIQDFTFDLSLDLLMVMEKPTFFSPDIRVLLLSITKNTNGPHELAENPIITFDADESGDLITTVSLQISEDFVGVLCCFEQPDRGILRIYNWKTGKEVFSMGRASGYVFFDSHNIIVLIDRIMFHHVQLSSPTGVRITPLMLPIQYPLRDPVIYYPSGRNVDYPQYLQKRMMVNDRSLDIFVLEADVVGDEQADPFLMFFSKQQIMDTINKLSLETVDGQIPWKDWGPKCTRWIPAYSLRTTGYSSISGSRFCCAGVSTPPFTSDMQPPPYGSGGEMQTFIYIFDFNPRPIQLGALPYWTDDVKMLVVKNTWSFEHAYFTEKVESCLPFRVFVSRQPCRYTTIYLDGDTIIGIMNGQFFIHPPSKKRKPKQEEEDKL